MAACRPVLLVALGLACVSVLFPTTVTADPGWLGNAEIVVPSDLENQDCRTGVCKHNENTDLTRWRGAIWFVHRTAGSQVLGPNSSLRVYRSKDQGETFQLEAIIPAPLDRDIRDPAFYTVGKRLYIKAITRLPGFSLRDTGVDSISIEIHSTDGSLVAAPTRSARRLGFLAGRAAGRCTTPPPTRTGTCASCSIARATARLDRRRRDLRRLEDTPLETELVFITSGNRMLALVRMDGDQHRAARQQGAPAHQGVLGQRPYKPSSARRS